MNQMSQIDRIVDSAAPAFRKAVRTLFSQARYAQAFNVCDGLNTETGIKTRVVCYLVVLPTDKVESFKPQLYELIHAAYPHAEAASKSAGDVAEQEKPRVR